MTLTYLSGDRIQGVSGDTKPTNVPTGTRFEETNTRKVYRYWSFNDPLHNYDMTTDPRDGTWNNNGAVGSITHANSTLQLNMNSTSGTGNAGSRTYIDLGSTLSSQFVLRFKTYQSSYTSHLNNSHHLVGLSSVAPTGSTGHITSTDWIGGRWYYGIQWGADDANKQGIEPRLGENTSSGNHNNASSVDRLYGRPNEGSNDGNPFYHEFRWNAGTLVFTLYGNADYSSSQLVQATVSSSSNTQWITGTPSNIEGLRYLVFYNVPDSSMGVYTMQLDDIKIWDGVSTVPSSNAWKEKGTA